MRSSLEEQTGGKAAPPQRTVRKPTTPRTESFAIVYRRFAGAHAQHVESVTEICYEHVYVLMLLTALVKLEHAVHQVSQPRKHISLTQPNALVVAASASSPRHPSP